jgi:isopenicillin-N epimerase
MAIARRQFLLSAAGLVSAGMAAPGCGDTPGASRSPVGAVEPTVPPIRLAKGDDTWADVRAQFDLDPDYIHMSALYISSHPRPVREQIDTFRQGIDRMPVVYLNSENRQRQRAVRTAAARYLGGDADDIALTDSTTMGIGMMYNGMRIEAGEEILTTDEDYYVTHEAVRTTVARYDATMRQIPLYEDSAQATVDEIVERIASEIRPHTRVLALTWVHSSTGMKLPIREIAAEARRRARNRDDLFICVDGVHGFGVEDAKLPDLDIDFFAAGCHKWLFGPRGTGLLWGRPRGWSFLKPIIPSFVDDEVWGAWLSNGDVTSPTTAERMTPGGFKAFEHQWAVASAFAFHDSIGRSRVASRTHELNRRLKEGLADMNHVQLATPMSDDLSAGLVCLNVRGMNASTAVRRIRERRVIATVTPYARRLVRFAPSIRNTPEEVDLALDAVRRLA